MDFPKHQLLGYALPSNMEIAQRLNKIFINSCYDRITSSSNFKLYEADKSISIDIRNHPWNHP